MQLIRKRLPLRRHSSKEVFKCSKDEIFLIKCNIFPRLPPIGSPPNPAENISSPDQNISVHKMVHHRHRHHSSSPSALYLFIFNERLGPFTTSRVMHFHTPFNEHCKTSLPIFSSLKLHASHQTRTRS